MVISLLPSDRFLVINKTILDAQDRLILNLLYQPIVGSIAISLYLTLWSFLDKNKISSIDNIHEDLVINMQIKLEDIKEAKDKLEAIGLIKTYLKKGEINDYIYELYGPLSASDFVKNPILNTALYNNVSKKEYKRIIECFTIPKVDLKDYKDISCSFKDIYSFIDSEKIESSNIKKVNHLNLSFEPIINFNELLSLIPEEILNLKSITKTDKDVIYQLSFIYNLNDDDMSEVLKNSIVNRKIDMELLKQNCRSFYKFEHKGKIPKITFQEEPSMFKQVTSKRDKLIYQFETTSPYEFLVLKQNSKPTNKDMELIEYLMIEQKLNPGVINVLIDYILKINNNKLVKGFVEQIAAQWKRSKIENVSDAMDFAKKEYENKKTKKINNVNNIKKEKIPEWINQDVKEEILSDEELLQFESELGR